MMGLLGDFWGSAQFITILIKIPYRRGSILMIHNDIYSLLLFVHKLVTDP